MHSIAGITPTVLRILEKQLKKDKVRYSQQSAFYKNVPKTPFSSNASFVVDIDGNIFRNWWV